MSNLKLLQARNIYYSIKFAELTAIGMDEDLVRSICLKAMMHEYEDNIYAVLAFHGYEWHTVLLQWAKKVIEINITMPTFHAYSGAVNKYTKHFIDCGYIVKCTNAYYGDDLRFPNANFTFELWA